MVCTFKQNCSVTEVEVEPYVGEVQLHFGEVQPYFGEVQRYFGIKGSSNENRLNLSQTAGTGTLLYRESKYAITGLYR